MFCRSDRVLGLLSRGQAHPLTAPAHQRPPPPNDPPLPRHDRRWRKVRGPTGEFARARHPAISRSCPPHALATPARCAQSGAAVSQPPLPTRRPTRGAAMFSDLCCDCSSVWQKKTRVSYLSVGVCRMRRMTTTHCNIYSAPVEFDFKNAARATLVGCGDILRVCLLF